MQNEILVGRFGQLFTKLFSIRGANPTPQLSPEIQPVFDIADSSESPENLYLRDERLCAGEHTSTADPGPPATDSIVRLRNPANSGILAVVSRIVISTSNLSAVAVFDVQTGGELTNLGRTCFRDYRITGSPSCIVSGMNDFGPEPAHSFTLATQANTVERNLWFDEAIIIPPDHSLNVKTKDTNDGLFVAFFWRERVGTPQELE